MLAAVAGALLINGGAAVSVWLTVSQLSDTPGLADCREFCSATHVGHLLMTRCAVAWLLVPLELLGAAGALGRALHAALGLALAATFSGLSHAGVAADAGRLPAIADFTHLLAIVLWAGPLLRLALLPSPPLDAVRRFSVLATACVALFLASGLYLAWFQLGTLQALLASRYGQLLCAKLAAVALVLGVAANNHWRLLERGDRAALQRNIRVEAAVVFIVVVLTGYLTTSSPPREYSMSRATLPTIDASFDS